MNAMTTMTTEQGVFEEGFAVKPFFDLFTVVIKKGPQFESCVNNI